MLRSVPDFEKYKGEISDSDLMKSVFIKQGAITDD